MPKHEDLLCKQRSILNLKDEMRSSVFKSYKILVEYFPGTDITPLIKLMNILDTEYKILVEEKILESINRE